jgi:hypothetical protein
MPAMDARAITAWFSVSDWSPLDPSWEQRRKAAWAWRKFKKARRWTRLLKLVPFVRMIAIGNALGYGNCTPESDIDLVIVTAPKRIWTVRLFTVTLLRLFRQRPGEHTRDAICPSFFLTTEAMNLEELQLEYSLSERSESKGRPSTSSGHIAHPPDPYLLFWPTQLTVLYDVGGTYDAFWRANEQWIRRWLPDARPRAVHQRLCTKVRRRISCCLLPASCFPDIGDAIERWSRRFQERRFSPEIRALANKNSRVVITDRMLKFHTNDRRAHYRERWMKQLAVNE